MRSLVPRLTSQFVFLALLLSTVPAHAWGPEGHAIVAEIAVDHLRPGARQALLRLLGDDGLAYASNWPDLILPALPETAPWHFVNIPSTSNGYLASRDCPQTNCVVAKIQMFSRILQDRHQRRPARSVALKFLIHLVGDIHQPFHAIGDARGGNDIPVSFFGAQQCGSNTCELHYVWDTALIRHSGLSEREYTDYLERMIAGAHLDPGSDDPEVWADESFKLAENAMAKPGANIDQSYYDRERPVLDRQLALAGLRLARLLNQDLDPASGSSAPEPR